MPYGGGGWRQARRAEIVALRMYGREVKDLPSSRGSSSFQIFEIMMAP